MEIEAQLESLDNKIEKYNKKTDKLSRLVGSLVTAIEQNKTENNKEGLKEIFEEIKSDYSKNQKGLNKKITELKSAITKANDTIENFSQNSVENIDMNKLKEIFDEFKVNSDNSNQAVNESISKLESMMNDYSKNLQTINLSTEDSSNIKEAVKSLNDSFYFELLQLFNSLSFEDEAEDLKDFMEEILSSVTLKTDENTEKLNSIMLQFKNLLNKIENIEKTQNSISDYLKPEEADDLVYSFDDIQSDLAKMRLVLNDISNSVSSQEIVEEISGKIKQTSDQIENISKLLGSSAETEEGAVAISQKIEDLNAQVYDISLRTNKLILTNEDSNLELRNNLELFREVFDKANPEKLYDLFYELTHYFNDVNDKISEVTTTTKAAHTEAVTIKNALVYVGEWLDNATNVLEEMRTNIVEILGTKPSRKTPSIDFSELEKEFEEIKERISEINIPDSDNTEIKEYISEITQTQQSIGSAIVNLNERFNNYMEIQQRRMDSIEENQKQIMNSIINNNSSQILSPKFNVIEEKFAEIENVLSQISEKILKD